MKRQIRGDILVIASHNDDKVDELRALLNSLNIKLVSSKELNLTQPKETGRSFQENARIKASLASEASGYIAIGDDSGLVIPALKGKPGIYSARWGGVKKDFALAMRRAHKALGKKDRFSWFAACLALAWPDGYCQTFVGRVYGTLAWPPRGKLGFGYDPMFQPLGYQVTFGEMQPSFKNKISHRSLAFHAFTEAFSSVLVD